MKRLEDITIQERRNRKLFVYAMLILEQNPQLDRQRIEYWRDGVYYKEFEQLLDKFGISGEYGISQQYIEDEM